VTYQQTIDWLFSLEGKLGMDFRLERLTPVLDRLDHPERSYPVLHIAGTNGKGSTSAMLHAILSAAGYCVGLYTSPHLISFRERIRVAERTIECNSVVRHVAGIRAAAEASGVELTYFEITTLAAFLEFRELGVDIAVVEVGLGGRLDATNVVHSLATAITSIGIDHAAFLGDSLETVAAEKAGIIKRGVPVVTGPLPAVALRVVEERAGELDAPLAVCGRDFGPVAAGAVSLAGAHQLENAAVAVAVIDSLDATILVPRSAVASGLAGVRWPGRLERLAGPPPIIVDGAHNPHAIAALVRATGAKACASPRILVFGAMADKDWRGMLDLLSGHFDRVVLVPIANARALDPCAAADYLSPNRACSVAASVAEGLNEAIGSAGRGGTVVVTGSIYLVGEAYQASGRFPDIVDAANLL
jgi:dihydrofolate synthase/folylpolyglutamate synthase